MLIFLLQTIFRDLHFVCPNIGLFFYSSPLLFFIFLIPLQCSQAILKLPFICFRISLIFWKTLLFPFAYCFMRGIIFIHNRLLTQLALSCPRLTLLQMLTELLRRHIILTILTNYRFLLANLEMLFQRQFVKFFLAIFTLFFLMKVLFMLFSRFFIINLPTFLAPNNIPSTISNVRSCIRDRYIPQTVLTFFSCFLLHVPKKSTNISTRIYYIKDH